MTDEEFAQRTADLLDEESKKPLSWWYLSFADDDGFLGCAIVQAHGHISACMESHRLGINPGGQMLSVPVDEDNPPPEAARNWLMQRPDVERYLGPVVRVGDICT